MGLKSAFAPALLALYGAALFAGLALGVFNPLIAAHLHAMGAGEVAVGFNGSLFFACSIAAAPIAGRLIAALGARGTLVIGVLIAALAAAPFAWSSAWPQWSLLRGLMGLGVGLYMVAGQTTLNALAEGPKRAGISGLYALAFAIGMGVGPLLGAQLYAAQPQLAFALGAAALLLSLPGVLLCLPRLRTPAHAADLSLLSRLGLPLHAIFAYGFAEATLMSLYPLWLIERGYTLSEMSWAFSAFVAGSLVATVPLTQAADRYGRERVLAGCALIGLISLSLLSYWPQIGVTAAAVCAGAALGPVFALALAQLGDRLSSAELPAGSALFTMSFSFGCLLAPLLSSLAMHSLGGEHIFALTLLILAALLLRLALGESRLRAGAQA